MAESRAHGRHSEPAHKLTRRSRDVPTGRRPLTVAMVFAVLLLAVLLVVVTFSRTATQESPAEPVSQEPTSRPPPTSPGSTRSGVLTGTATLVGLDDVRVSEVVEWPEGGPSAIRLMVPPHPELVGAAAQASPRVENLAVRIDDVLVRTVAVDGATNTWDVQVPAAATPKRMDITYDLRGTVVHSTPSVPGRAIAVLSPLAASVAPGGAVIAVLGSGVRNVYCPGLPVEQLLCGRLDGDTWRVRLPGATSSPVLVQVDLPIPAQPGHG